MFGAAPGAGVNAVQPVQSPLPQQQPDMGKLLEALKAAFAAQGGLNSSAFRAQSLRGDRNYAPGTGPLGIRVGEGPGGWAVSLADSVNNALNYKEQKARDEALSKALKDLQEAKGGFGVEAVSQGTPLTPLGL